MGAAAGGTLQLISEAISYINRVSAQQHAQIMASSEEGRKWLEAENAAADAAAERSRKTGWITNFVIVVVVTAAFVLSWINGLPAVDVVTSIVTEQEGFSLLWGLISFGPDMVVTEAKGWVQGPQFWPAVEAVLGFTVGIKGIKSVKSRL